MVLYFRWGLRRDNPGHTLPVGMCVATTNGKATTKKMTETGRVRPADEYDYIMLDDYVIILFILEWTVRQTRTGPTTSLLLGE